MNKKTLSMLSKSELIDIIQSDRMWETKAFRKVLYIVGNKISNNARLNTMVQP